MWLSLVHLKYLHDWLLHCLQNRSKLFGLSPILAINGYNLSVGSHQFPNWLLDSGQMQGPALLLKSQVLACLCAFACALCQQHPFPASFHTANSFKVELRQHLLWEAFPDIRSLRFQAQVLPEHVLFYKPLIWVVISCLLLSLSILWALGWHGLCLLSLPSWSIQHSGCQQTRAQYLLRINYLSSSWVLLSGISEAKFFLPKTY